ncbi:hypothetical protein BJ944DRAFT_229963 [Cunninghamella echinulata]|nr:hypothetical protein BJ944DRAFT_229963 [Cunninghamella echinulata]
MSSKTLKTEYQQIQAQVGDGPVDMKDIERRLKKLETRLIAYLKDGSDDHQSSNTISSNSTTSNPQLFSTAPVNKKKKKNNSGNDNDDNDAQPFIDPLITLQDNKINITTSLNESHHFAKLLVSGINPTFVREKSNTIFTRQLKKISPVNQHTHHQLSHVVLDKESTEELAWVDMVLTTRYARCFILYQMVEKDKLVELISQPYIDSLRGQNKLDLTLLSKAVRAYIYNHEKYASHQHFNHGHDDLLSKHINTNRGEFYFQQAEEILELCFMTSSRNNIRSLLHMYMYQITSATDHLKAIHYSDLAIRMAQVLNLNKEKGMLINEVIREDDRRLWWSCVWIHVSASIHFNRPLLLNESDILDARRQPRKRQNETNEIGYCLDFCIHSVKLMLLTRSIKQCLQTKTTEIQLIHHLKYIEQQLEDWLTGLPETLNPFYWQQQQLQQNNNNNNNSNNSNSNSNSNSNANTTTTTMQEIMVEINDIELQEVPSRAFGIELALLLFGEFTTLKLNVYESFQMNDQRILDLIAMRNRFDAVMEYTNYLLLLVPQSHPCLIFYILTIMEPSFNTLYELALYQHDTSMANRAVQQLLSLQNMLKHYPFENDVNVYQLILDIDNVLQKVNITHHHHHQQQQGQQQQQASIPTSPIINSSLSFPFILDQVPLESPSASTSYSTKTNIHQSYYNSNNNDSNLTDIYNEQQFQQQQQQQQPTAFNYEYSMQDIQYNNNLGSQSNPTFIRGDISNNSTPSNISNSLVYPSNN